MDWSQRSKYENYDVRSLNLFPIDSNILNRTSATDMKSSSNDDDDGEVKSYQIALIVFVIVSVGLAGAVVFLLLRKTPTESINTQSLL